MMMFLFFFFIFFCFFFFFKQKTAYEIYQCDWSSDVCSSDLSSPESDSVDSSDTNSLFMRWSNLLNNDAQEVEFSQLPFDHPEIGRASCRERV